MLRIVSLVMLALGFAGLWQEYSDDEPAHSAPIHFWTATPEWTPDENRGIDLSGTTIYVSPSAGHVDLESFKLIPQGDSWSFSVRLFLTQRESWSVEFRANGERGLVRMWKEGGRRRPPMKVDCAFGSGRAKALSIVMEAGRIDAHVEGAPVLAFADEAFQPVALRTHLAGNNARLIDLRQSSEADGRRVNRREPFGSDDSTDNASERGVFALLAVWLGALGVLALFLLAQCGPYPGFGPLLGATLTAAAMPSIPWALAIATRVPGRDGLTAALAVFGVVVAGFQLRRSLVVTRQPSPSPSRSVLIVLLIAVPAVWIVGRQHFDGERDSLAHAVTAYSDVSRRPTGENVARRSLNAGNQLSFIENYRNLELTAKVDFSDAAILEARLRAHPSRAEGVALLASGDERVQTGFYAQSAREHRLLTSGTKLVAPGEHRLRIVARGPEFEAWMDDEPIASARHAESVSGTIVLLAARGRVTISDLQIVPLDEPVLGRAKALTWFFEPILPGILALLLMGLLTAVLVAVPLHWALAAQSFAWLPVATLVLLPEHWDQTALMWSGATTATLLLLHLFLKGRSTSAPRFLFLTACAIGASAVVTVTATKPLPATSGKIADNGALGAAVLFDDRTYLMHPVARQLNDYLAKHEFRGVPTHPRKANAVTRILSLGTSSTYGFKLAPNESYPAMLEQLLNEDRQGKDRVEVVNAGWPGTNGPSIFRFLRDGLADFQFDIITLSLFYNDSFDLTQWDLDAHYRRLDSLPPWRRTLENTRAGLELSKGRTTLKRVSQAFDEARMTSAEAWAAVGGAAGNSPPVRYDALLRRFADYASSRGVPLVFILEPVADDARRLWKDEFREVTRTLAAEFGFPVVDPTPALLRAGGKSLYLEGDEIHPRAEGNQVIATELLPAIRELMQDKSRGG